MPSQPVRLYQGDTHFVIIYYFLKLYIYVLKLVYMYNFKTILKDTNITKSDLNCNFFEKY